MHMDMYTCTDVHVHVRMYMYIVHVHTYVACLLVPLTHTITHCHGALLLSDGYLYLLALVGLLSQRGFELADAGGEGAALVHIGSASGAVGRGRHDTTQRLLELSPLMLQFGILQLEFLVTAEKEKMISLIAHNITCSCIQTNDISYI